MLVDDLRLLLGVLVTAADVSDLASAKQLLKGRRLFPCLRLIWADSAYAVLVGWAARYWDWTPIAEAIGGDSGVRRDSAALGGRSNLWLVDATPPPLA